MADEGQAHLAVSCQFRFMSTAGSRSDHGVAYQAAELPGTLAKSGILQSIFQHLWRTRSYSNECFIHSSTLVRAVLFPILEQTSAGLLAGTVSF